MLKGAFSIQGYFLFSYMITFSILRSVFPFVDVPRQSCPVMSSVAVDWYVNFCRHPYTSSEVV